ncbi:hypothetical protein [Gracilibacillus sp. JCM 18860]|uniref:hypothetical protein n=1 Tax=Gracilibacillus sp. JCM 18860 TaxID=1306159 RepID=UPI003261B3DC
MKNLLIGTKDKVDGFANKVTHNGLTYGLFGYGWSFSFTVDLKAGETYTVSVPVFNPSETDTSQARIVRGQELGNYLELVQPRKATTITNTFTPTQDEEGATIRFLVNGSQYPALGWYYPMLQKGNIDTGWTPALEDVQTEIDSAKETASTAKTTADGKNTVIYSASQPSTAGRKVNDVWFDTNDGYKMYRFDGSKWVAAQFGENAIVAHSITANHIKSLLGLNVNDQFIVDANGNVKFAGNLEGASYIRTSFR